MLCCHSVGFTFFFCLPKAMLIITSIAFGVAFVIAFARLFKRKLNRDSIISYDLTINQLVGFRMKWMPRNLVKQLPIKRGKWYACTVGEQRARDCIIYMQLLRDFLIITIGIKLIKCGNIRCEHFTSIFVVVVVGHKRLFNDAKPNRIISQVLILWPMIIIILVRFAFVSVHSQSKNG